MSCTTSMYVKHVNLIKIGEKIRALRENQGLSQEDFAYAADLARTYMGRVERVQNLIKIALTLKVEVGDLIPPPKTT